MPNTSALHEHLLNLMVAMLLMPALLFDIRFADSNAFSSCIAQYSFSTLYFWPFDERKLIYQTTLP